MADPNQQLAQDIYKHLQQRGFNRYGRNHADLVKASTWLSESPFIEKIIGKKAYQDPAKHARALADSLDNSWNIVNKAELLASTGHSYTWFPFHKFSAKRTLADARLALFQEGQQFIKDASALQNELAAVSIINSARDRNTLAEVLKDFHTQYDRSEKAFRKMSPDGARTLKDTFITPREFEAASEFIRLHEVRKHLIDKVSLLEDAALTRNQSFWERVTARGPARWAGNVLQIDLPEVKNTFPKGNPITGAQGLFGALLNGQTENLGEYVEIKGRDEQIKSIQDRIANLVKKVEPRLKSLAEDANKTYETLLSQGHKVPEGKVSAGLFVNKINKSTARIIKSMGAGAASILAAVQDIDNVEAAAAQEVGNAAKAIKTAEQAIGKAASEVKKAVNSTEAAVTETAKDIGKAAGETAEAAEAAATTGKRSWAAMIISPHMKDGKVIETAGQAIREGAISPLRLAGAATVGYLGYKLLSPSKTEEPKYKKLAASPPLESAAAQR